MACELSWAQKMDPLLDLYCDLAALAIMQSKSFKAAAALLKASKPFLFSSSTKSNVLCSYSGFY